MNTNEAARFFIRVAGIVTFLGVCGCGTTALLVGVLRTTGRPTSIPPYPTAIAQSPPVGGAAASPTPTKTTGGSQPVSTPPPALAPVPEYRLVFDSTITDMLGKEHVRAEVVVRAAPGTANLTGEAPLQILKADGDQASGGSCQNNQYQEDPGLFRVVSAQLLFKPASGNALSRDLKDVILLYSLDPQVQCPASGTSGPNDWNLFWMAYAGHFQHTDDQLDNSGPAPLISARSWEVTASTARKVYQWSDATTGISENTTIDLKPTQP